jgi:hypothetical protein
MADERMAQDATALDEATDHVIREMTHVQVSDDAVARVMARVRAANDATGHPAMHVGGGARQPARRWPRGWLVALQQPRISMGAAMAAAAVAAIVAAGATLAVVRDSGRDGDRARGGSVVRVRLPQRQS